MGRNRAWSPDVSVMTSWRRRVEKPQLKCFLKITDRSCNSSVPKFPVAFCKQTPTLDPSPKALHYLAPACLSDFISYCFLHHPLYSSHILRSLHYLFILPASGIVFPSNIPCCSFSRRVCVCIFSNFAFYFRVYELIQCEIVNGPPISLSITFS